MKILQSDYSIESMIDKYFEGLAERPRLHLGCSQLGHPCDRWLWLSFRWAVIPKFPGRILRLFKRGQDEEAKVIANLRAIGMDIRYTGTSQSKVAFGSKVQGIAIDGASHIQGSIDGVIYSGVPGSPNKKHILEIKTFNLKSFNELVKNGLFETKKEHYIQMQMYMHGMDIKQSLYVAVCKDNDHIYSEVIDYQQDVAIRYLQRGKLIVESATIPSPISNDPGWYQCKMCPAHDFCHKSKLTKEVNCRTCAHSTPVANNKWFCKYHDDYIPDDFQYKGCDGHTLHQDLVPWHYKGRSEADKWVAIYKVDGVELMNGESDNKVFSSKELVRNPSGCARCAQGDQGINDFRNNFDGEITG